MKAVTGVRGKGAHVQGLWESDDGVELFPAHVRVVEAFEVYDQDLGEAEDGQFLLEVVDLFALGALVAALLHALRADETLEAVGEADIPSDLHPAAGNRNAQVHEVVESQTRVATVQTLNPVHQLASEQVRDYGVVSVLVVLPPFFRLLFNSEVVEVEFFIGLFLCDSVELFMDAV